MIYHPNRLRIMNEDDYNDSLGWAKTYASHFVEEVIERTGKAPDLDDFIETYPLYDHEIMYKDIEKHMQYIAKIVFKEMGK